HRSSAMATREGGQLLPTFFIVLLLQQREYALLHLVRLGQRRDAGLVQDRVLGEVGHFRCDIGGTDAVFSSRQVLRLVLDNRDCALQAVNASADVATNAGYVGDGCVDVAQCGLGIGNTGGIVYARERVAADVNR